MARPIRRGMENGDYRVTTRGWGRQTVVGQLVLWQPVTLRVAADFLRYARIGGEKVKQAAMVVFNLLGDFLATLVAGFWPLPTRARGTRMFQPWSLTFSCVCSFRVFPLSLCELRMAAGQVQVIECALWPRLPAVAGEAIACRRCEKPGRR